MKSFKDFKKKIDKNIDDSDMFIHFRMDNEKREPIIDLANDETFIHFKRPNLSVKEERSKNTHSQWVMANDNSHIASTNYGVSNHLSDRSKERSESVKDSVRRYTTDSIDLNKKLVSKHPLNVHEQQHVKHLDSVANEPAPEDHYLYSGLGKKRAKKIKDANGGQIRLPAYTSLTTSKSIARSFAHNHSYQDEQGQIIPVREREYHYISLHVKKGQKVGHIAHHSEHEDEMESILPRNTKIRVNPTPTINLDGHSNKHHIWHAEITDQD